MDEITVDELFDHINSNDPPLIIDTRDETAFNGSGEYKYEKLGHIEGSRRIFVSELPSHFEDLQSFKNKEIVMICQGGGMSLVAVEIMVNAGFTEVKNLKGGIVAWHKKGYPLVTIAENAISPREERVTIIEEEHPLAEKYLGEVHYTLDARGLVCPQPILKSKKKLKALKVGQVLEILTTDPGSKRDIPAWARVTGQELLVLEEHEPQEFRFLVKRIK